MPEPEISRRCHECGASSRSNALFCPQCGNPVAGQDPGKADFSATLPLIPEKRTEAAETLAIDSSVTQPFIPAATPPVEAPPAIETKSQDDISTPVSKVRTTAAKRSPANAPPTRSDRVLDHVGRIKQASIVMLDQAAYDPSLRFLLVAAALVVMFLILLVLSKMIG